MRIPVIKYRITPICTTNRGIEGAVDFALKGLKVELLKALTNCPKDNFEITTERVTNS